MDTEHTVIAKIEEAIKSLQFTGDTSEDGRTKSIVITKLQEALLWAERIYNPLK